jgi:GNAT superfamily N-acetyltransferase
MNIRLAKLEELPALLDIYDGARLYMRENGNAEQWSGGYPNAEVLTEDIENGRLYVCEDAGVLLGVFCYFEGTDPTYTKIYDGEWLDEKHVGVMHRVAVAVHRKGVASFCYEYCFEKSKNLRIDTHRDNIPMQRSLVKNGFRQCGIIHLLNGDERLAYQKIVE